MTTPGLPTEEEIARAIAAFLRLRDEEVPDPDDRTDDERAESARAVLDLIRPAFEAKARERDEARQIVRDIYWMALRYADGRQSYAPGMCNDALRKAYDGGWLVHRHQRDPAFARDGSSPEYRSLEARALSAEAKLAQAVSFDLGDDITVESRGNGTWAVKSFGSVLNSAGQWEWEPRPSSRDDEFISRTRFPLDDAFRRARSASAAAKGETK